MTTNQFDVQYVDVVAPPTLTVKQAQDLHDIADRFDGIFVHYESQPSWVYTSEPNAPDDAIVVQFQFYNKQATGEATKAFRKYLRRNLPRRSWLVETYPPESTQQQRQQRT